MARGKGNFRRKHSAKSKANSKTSRPPGKKSHFSKGRDIKHRDQFKRPNVNEDVKRNVLKRRKIQEDSASEESEGEQDSYRQLLTTFTQSKTKPEQSVDSEDESGGSSSAASDDDDSNLTPDTAESESERETGEPASGGENAKEGSTTLKRQEHESELDSDQDDGIPNSTLEQHQESVDGGDPFHAHFCCDLSEGAADTLSKPKPPIGQSEICWESLGRIVVAIPQLPSHSTASTLLSCKASLEEPKPFVQQGKVPDRLNEVDWSRLYVRPELQKTIPRANSQIIDTENSSQDLTSFQLELFTLLNTYQDLYFPERTFSNGEAVRLAYCLHAANHILKTRNLVVHHNAKLTKKTCSEVPEEFRDQGLVRPRVLILVPFREQARRVVEMLIKLIFPEDSKGVVMNKSRFEEEFGGQEPIMSKKNPRPEDYEMLFSGNSDDTFRIGLTLTKKCLKLYADFYSSDIIISSPLGLRMIVGAEGESQRDYDFLASVEILILDQVDVFFMQNWDHLLHVMDHLHLQPKDSHGTDFSRVRSWAVNGWAKYYRQTVLFSSVALPACSALLNKRCNNHAGFARVANPINSGTICQVIVQLPQIFQQVEASSVSQALDSRFNYFVKKVLPEHLDTLMSHTVIFVPSYFDFVRIRNYLRKEGLSFVQICEYSKDGKVARARDMFFHSQVQFLLYSERFHFFRRPRIKGIRHIIFYQPPTMPHFYSEMCNLMQESNQNPHGGSESNMTVTVLYSRFDAQQLAAIVGSDRASRMINSDRSVHMFVTGE